MLPSLGQPDYEFYETPDPVTRWLCRWTAAQGHPIEGVIFEPCVGDGAIVRACARPRQAWRTNDLDSRWCAMPMDACEVSTWIHHVTPDGLPVDWTVTNPPFSLAVPILSHALCYSRVGVAMYLRLSIHEPLKTGIRRCFFADHPPTAVLMLPRFAHQRSRTKGIWSTDSMTSCWCVWLQKADWQAVAYAPESVIDELEAFTPAYRERMDALNGLSGPEEDRQRQWRERWKGVAA